MAINRIIKRIVILISGSGSNMQAIVRACVAERWPAQVVAVLSNKADAHGLAFAQAQGIATQVIDHTQFTQRSHFDAALAQAVQAQAPDLLVLAGFMRILSPEFVQPFEGRMLNIHPSLLPAFTGLHTHQRALDTGCKVAGATVHFVTAELDHGPIAAQAWTPILPNDNVQSLSKRVLALEHRMYPQVVSWWAHGHLQLHDGVVHQTQGQSQLFC
jgi:phosphoribosylglycinamide formyltransferase 1